MSNSHTFVCFPFILYESKFIAHMWCWGVQWPQRPEGGVTFSRTGITDACEPWCRFSEGKRCPLEGPEVLLTAQPSFQPLVACFWGWLKLLASFSRPRLALNLLSFTLREVSYCLCSSFPDCILDPCICPGPPWSPQDCFRSHIFCVRHYRYEVNLPN